MSVFGVTPDGTEVRALTLDDGTLRATVLTYGAILNDLRLAGSAHALTLGAPELGPYLGGMAYYGAIVGPVANRIAGASAQIDGETCRFPANEGANTLHSGPAGTHALHWTVEDHDDRALTLSLELPHGFGGFPGARRVTARYHLPRPGTLALDITARTDRPTLFNFAHHGYWNLDGTPTYAGHRLRIAADRVLPVDDAQLPTGAADPVADTPFDFRAARILTPGESPRIDHNFCLSDTRLPCRPVAELTGTGGIAMTIETTEPGLQVFDGGNSVAAAYTGHDGRTLGPFAGLAMEPQAWPDAPHHQDFPTILFGPDEPYRQSTRYRFSRLTG